MGLITCIFGFIATTIIGGKLVFHRGKLVNVDQAELFSDVRELVQTLSHRIWGQ